MYSQYGLFEDRNIVTHGVGEMMVSIFAGLKTLELNTDIRQQMSTCLNDVDHKLHAVRYHLDNYKRAEGEKVNYAKHTKGVGLLPRCLEKASALLREIS